MHNTHAQCTHMHTYCVHIYWYQRRRESGSNKPLSSQKFSYLGSLNTKPYQVRKEYTQEDVMLKKSPVKVIAIIFISLHVMHVQLYWQYKM